MRCKQASHFDHWRNESDASRRTKLKGSPVDLWLRVAASAPPKCVDAPPNDTGYPAAVLSIFESASRRCPSIILNREIMEGQPCIVGTRIPVKAVLRAIEQYGSLDGVRKCYPHLTNDQVEDALYFSQLVLELPSGIDQSSVASR
jgi:uncharacterized protein (DUF433 family)